MWAEAMSDAGKTPRRLAVVVKGWPRLSETFIAQELAELEARGVTFEIWSLRRPTDTQRHALHDQVRAPVRYLPEYLREAPLRVLRGLFAALGRRGFWRATGVWLKDLARDRSLNRIRRFGQALTLAREAPPEIMGFYAHFLHTPASVTRYAAIIRGAPWGASAHAKDIWTTPAWEKREKLAEAEFVATCTSYGAEALRALAPQPENVRLVYHGLDLSRFPSPPDRSAALARGGPYQILSVGRLVEKKGFDRLIEALALLPSDLDWRWVHIGGGSLQAALAERAATLGVADRIEWRGPAAQDAVIAAMRAADVFALPSRIARDGDRDGLPNVLMEAASQELAIVATPVSAIPEFVEDGVHGLLRSDAPAEIAAALAELAADPARRLALGRAARARLVGAFGMAAGIDQLEPLVRALAPSPPGRRSSPRRARNRAA